MNQINNFNTLQIHNIDFTLSTHRIQCLPNQHLNINRHDKNGRTDVTTNVFVRMVKLDDTNVTTGKNIMFTEGLS
jgi:hypothetical protein